MGVILSLGAEVESSRLSAAERDGSFEALSSPDELEKLHASVATSEGGAERRSSDDCNDCNSLTSFGMRSEPAMLDVSLALELLHLLNLNTGVVLSIYSYNDIKILVRQVTVSNLCSTQN